MTRSLDQMTRLKILFILPILVDFSLADNNMYRSLGSIADQIAAAAREKAQQPYNSSYQHPPIAHYPELLLAEPFAVTRLELVPDDGQSSSSSSSAGARRRLVARESYVTGLDYHLAGDRLYWTDRPTGRVLSAVLNPRTRLAAYEAPQVLVELGPEEWRPQALAVDHATGKLYVADSRGRRVHAIELAAGVPGQRQRRAVMLDEGQLRAALDVAIDAEEGLLFVADGTGIVRSNTDGSEARVIIGHESYHIKSVALDLARKRVYWSDEAYHRIKRANYDGSEYGVVLRNAERHERSMDEPEEEMMGKRVYNDDDANHQQAQPTLGSPGSLALGRDRLYFHDEARRLVASVDLDPATGLALPTTYRQLYDRLEVRAMRLLDPARQPVLRDPCAGGGGGCEELCFIGPGGVAAADARGSCACEGDRLLGEDGKSCS